ncbi:MurR/RpiR family transcriptional regulator [Pseudoteredinibacter isoporae]|uniref:DNA-binding MurR/RpiR family transcriptional regulator n=1 Tax=Pseudoteredinibacter isoporae TaxID=570281 RepID=A0A7X0MWI9_9GAMM|nr:MurR/RpiR family transcriptional regulator [Pseudoteredinibacter isoporae]MBB6522528.1 DNA-binding MurR/RpiR family transcriptional regulator [Pseudoteredinibacter isoporae]NHO88058.1 MurR/RpiR family transcriptional regulator [Pseudoteredinibacter isoporae]NIB23611.1 MurR/RpiR family transcriptional regulator [Pseudoteredinibacter isoporae]
MLESAPQEYEELIEAISNNHANLSKRLKQIASFALEHPTTMGIETIANIAQSAEVQPSALIRFAKNFGFSGFSDMQRIFQRYVTEQSESYKERVARELAENNQDEPDSLQALFQQFCDANVVSLEHLKKGIDVKDIEKAVRILQKAEQIYIVGQRRSLPIASYLTYTLSRADCRVHLIDGSGGLLREQARAMSKKDALIAITFHPYSADTSQVVDIAVEKSIPYVAISDSSVSPIVDQASVSFNVHEAEVHNFRSLSATMLLAQTLATGLVFDDKKQNKKRRS